MQKSSKVHQHAELTRQHPTAYEAHKEFASWVLQRPADYCDGGDEIQTP